jgi:hypothetical protein
VTASEFPGAVDPKRIVPNHPALERPSELAMKLHLELGSERVVNRQPECATRLEYPHNLAAPGQAPLEIGKGITAVVVDIVIITYVKGRVSKNRFEACQG